MLKLKNPQLQKRRNLINQIFNVSAFLAIAFAMFWLIWILGLIIIKGTPALSLSLFTELTPPPSLKEGGGLMNAIIGSLIILVIAVVIGTPLGILAGVYLAEYGKDSWFAETLRAINDVLLSAPSIVIGLFVYIVIVLPMGGFSALAGSIALALIQIPIITRTTENMLSLVPNTLRESAYALGIPKYRVILQITSKIALSGILTGFILSVSRIAGETGPLLFTSLNSQFLNLDVTKPMSSLPMAIYQFAFSPYQNWQDLAWSGVLIITLVVLALNLVTKLIVSKHK